MIDGITRRQTFETLRQEGIRVRGSRLSLTYVPRDAGTQVAFAITRKVGGAVVRNRARRRVRAVLDHRMRAGQLRPGSYLVQIRSALDDLSSTALHRAVDDLLASLDARLTA